MGFRDEDSAPREPREELIALGPVRVLRGSEFLFSLEPTRPMRPIGFLVDSLPADAFGLHLVDLRVGNVALLTASVPLLALPTATVFIDGEWRMMRGPIDMPVVRPPERVFVHLRQPMLDAPWHLWLVGFVRD